MRNAFITVLIAVSTPAFASDGGAKAPSVDGQATQTSPKATTAESQEPRKICKRIEATESRVAAKKVCLTEEQWKKRDLEESGY